MGRARGIGPMAGGDACRHDRCDRVGRVVHPVVEIEDERQDDRENSELQHGLGSRSGVFEEDVLDVVRDVLAAVGGLLDVLVDLLPLEDLPRVLLLTEERPDGGSQDTVRRVLQRVDLDQRLGSPSVCRRSLSPLTACRTSATCWERMSTSRRSGGLASSRS